MRGVADERGAVAVVVALLMVPLIAFAAVSLDVAGMYWERSQLQAGADAAALAIAQQCSRGPTCGSPSTLASTFATANDRSPGVSATVLTPSLSPATGEVSVQTQTTRHHVFAPLIGVDSTRLGAGATVRWGAPAGGTAVLPLALSWCEFKAQTDGGVPSTSITSRDERIIHFTKGSDVTGCTGPSGNVVPGGFGWLPTVHGTCQAASAVDDTLYSSPGASVPNGCTPGDFNALLGKTVLLPLYDAAGDSGSNAYYKVYGYAAFTLTGYDFVGQFSSDRKTCRGNDNCVQGYFVRFVDLSQAFSYSTSAPSLGASVARLTS